MELIGIVLIGVGLLLIGSGFYSFYLTTMVKRRSDAELFALYPGTAQFYQQTAKTAQQIISCDGLQLYGELYQKNQNSQTKKLIILVHGYKNNRLASLQYIPMFWQHGYDVLTIDQRSHGRSEGKFATYSHFERKDLAQWIEKFQPHYQEIGLHGHSMGGATVLALSQNHNIQFVISEAGLTQAAQGVQTYVQNRLFLPNWAGKIMIFVTNIFTRIFAGFSLYQTNPGTIAEQSSIPLLVIHGTADDSVPFWMSEALIAKKTKGYKYFWAIEGGSHKELYQQQPEQYQTVVAKFLAARSA